MPKIEIGRKGGSLGQGVEPRGGNDRLGAPWSEKTKDELGHEGGGARARSVSGEEGRACRTLWQGQEECFRPKYPLAGWQSADPLSSKSIHPSMDTYNIGRPFI